MTGSDDEEFYLVPLDDHRVLAVPVETASDDSPPHWGDLVRAVGPLIGAALRQGNVNNARVYELSPESQRQLATARTDQLGAYFRGVLRDQDGKVSHQVQLREVTPATAPTPSEFLAAAQMAAIQAQLTRMEAVLNDVALSVDRVVSFVERQQRSKLLAALGILGEVHDRTRDAGKLSDIDWQRLSGVELELEAQLRAVSEELSARLGKAHFDGNPKRGAAAMGTLDPGRIKELVELHRLLLGGLRRWQEILMLRMYVAGELDEHEVHRTSARLARLTDQHLGLMKRLEKVANQSRKTKPRSNLERLFTDGIWLGSSNDERHLRAVKSGRKVLMTSVKNSRRVLAPPVGEPSELVSAGDTE